METSSVTSRASKRSRLSSSDTKNEFLTPSTPESALRDLEENGYFWLRGVVPEALCERCAKAIQADIGRRLDEGSVHQEEPMERLDKRTGEVMLKVRDHVLETIIQGKASCLWLETLF